jgi:hypothetical protein
MKGQLLLQELRSNSTESEKQNCVLQRTRGVLQPNTLARKSEEGPRPRGRNGAESDCKNQPRPHEHTKRL